MIQLCYLIVIFCCSVVHVKTGRESIVRDDSAFTIVCTETVKIWSFALSLSEGKSSRLCRSASETPYQHVARLCWHNGARWRMPRRTAPAIFLSAAASIRMPPHLLISPSWWKSKPPCFWSSLSLVLCAGAGDQTVKVDFLFELLWSSLALLCKLNVWCKTIPAYQTDKSMESIDEEGVCGVIECFGWQECFHPIPLGKYPQILCDTILPNKASIISFGLCLSIGEV
jgi:hypothetical protein